jgi:hypothetical protein
MHYLIIYDPPSKKLAKRLFYSGFIDAFKIVFFESDRKKLKKHITLNYSLPSKLHRIYALKLFLIHH